VCRAIEKLNSRTKGGPDGIPPSFFINCCDELSQPLSLLFALSMENSFLPSSWLLSYITPIFKKGNSADANNYRPISLTATMCKLMESVIKYQMVQFLVEKGILNKRQHAFIKNHSTASNLLDCLRDWTVGLNSHSQTDLVYIDFSKAFDSIVHAKLLFKLELYGITGKLLQWISGFLSNRQQCVVLEHVMSPVSDVLSGVPQGTVLGPILILIYINDIDSVCCGNTVVQLYADDVKLYSNITVNNACIQQSLNSLSLWAKEWQLSININKCSVLSICSAASKTYFEYCIGGIPIPRQNSNVDLGVTITDELTFEAHINCIISKARQRLSAIFRGFLSRNVHIMRRAFITYVRPILEYNSVVWNPCAIHLIDSLENVQRNFTKRLPTLKHLTYFERLASLGLEPLGLRRLRFDSIYYFKIFNHLTPLDPDEVFIAYQPISSSRSSPYLQRPTKASNRTLSVLFYRCISAWNNLPGNLRHVSSLPAFKRGLRDVDLSLFLKGSVF
jgi:hypothetical protein